MVSKKRLLIFLVMIAVLSICIAAIGVQAAQESEKDPGSLATSESESEKVTAPVCHVDGTKNGKTTIYVATISELKKHLDEHEGDYYYGCSLPEDTHRNGSGDEGAIKGQPALESEKAAACHVHTINNGHDTEGETTYFAKLSELKRHLDEHKGDYYGMCSLTEGAHDNGGGDKGGNGIGGDGTGGDGIGGKGTDGIGSDGINGKGVDGKGVDGKGSGDGIGGKGIGGKGIGGDAQGGDAKGGNAKGGNAKGGDAHGGDAKGGNAIGGDAHGGDAIGGTAQSGNANASGD